MEEFPMICPRCGNKLTKDNAECSCGIKFSYDSEVDDFILDMSSVKNDSIKELARNIKACDDNHEAFDVYIPQLIFELKTSFLLMAAYLNENANPEVRCANFRGKEMLMLFTSKAEFDKSTDEELPIGIEFREAVKLIEQGLDGFVIDEGSEAIELSKGFIEENFREC